MTYGDLLSHSTATRAGPQISVGFHRVFWSSPAPDRQLFFFWDDDNDG